MKQPLPGTIIVTNREIVLAKRVYRATSWLDQLRGVIGWHGFAVGDALVLPKCRQVHTAFSPFTLCVVFLAHETGLPHDAWRVLDVQTLPPWRVGAWVRGAGLAVEIRGEHEAPSVETGEIVFLRNTDAQGFR